MMTMTMMVMRREREGMSLSSFYVGYDERNTEQEELVKMDMKI